MVPVNPRGLRPLWPLSALEELGPDTQWSAAGPSLWPLKSCRVRKPNWNITSLINRESRMFGGGLLSQALSSSLLPLSAQFSQPGTWGWCHISQGWEKGGSCSGSLGGGRLMPPQRCPHLPASLPDAGRSSPRRTRRSIQNIALLASHPAAQGYLPHEVLPVYQTQLPFLASHSPRVNRMFCVFPPQAPGRWALLETGGQGACPPRASPGSGADRHPREVC